MKQVIDLDNWNRKEHFAFFSAFDDPFFGITTLVDFTDIYRQSKELNVSFFLYSLHFLLKCANETDAFYYPFRFAYITGLWTEETWPT